MAWDADQFKTPLISQQLIRPFLPPSGNPQPLTIILRGAQPTLSRAGVARRDSQDRTCSPAETLSVKNCPSGQTPQANNKCIMLFGADIPCKVTKTSERHEHPLTCGCRRGGVAMPKHDGLVSVSERARAKSTGNNISASPQSP